MTLPPDLTTLPSGSATLTPRTRSRGPPKRERSGPESALATRPPMVAPRSGGSRASIWPSEANTSWAAASGTPASSTAVRSPALCSTIRSTPAVDSSRSASTGGPQPCFEPPPTMRTGPPAASSAAMSCSEAIRNPRRLQGVLAIGARDLAAEPRRWHQLPRIGELVRVERAAQLLERLEVGLVEHLRHVALLVDADAVLAGDRAAGVYAGLDDQPGQLLGALGLALAGAVVADEGMEVAVTGVEDVGHPQAVLV